MILAIDPGASGGLAWRDDDGVVNCADMPATPGDILDQIRSLIETEAEISATALTAAILDIGAAAPSLPFHAERPPPITPCAN